MVNVYQNPKLRPQKTDGTQEIRVYLFHQTIPFFLAFMYPSLLNFIRKYLRRYNTRFLSRWAVFGFDLVLLSLAYLFTQWIRYNFTGVFLDLPLLLAHYGVIVAFFSIGFLLYQSHVGIIRHSGSTDFARLAKASLFAFVGLTVLREIALRTGIEALSLSYAALATTSLGFLALSVGMRITIRNVFYSLANSYVNKNRVGVLIFGAGNMGRSAKEAIDADVRGEGFAVAYVDDHPNKVGKNINGLPILSADYALRPSFVKENQIQRVVVAAKSVSSLRIKALTQQALEVGLEVKRVPPIGKWVNGELTATQIRAVSVEDLLGRDTIQLSYNKLNGFLAQKTIMVTGAAGSIGSELVQQILLQQPATLLAVDQAETPLYELDLEHNRHDGVLVPLVANVAHEERMKYLFERYRPDVVFHAAAYKHVPLMEAHPEEAVRTNCLGTAVVARLAREFQCEAFVMVSTDKAVNPTNVMGATKRAAEHAIQAENRHPGNKTRFVTTRFGNVLGSNGSVIPLFQRQIAQGGPLTVTHKEITRYFMTIPEAVRLVLEAGHMGRGGELYVFDMGEPVRIYDLALQLIQLSGLRPGVDIEVKEVGLRPGEKLYEELLANAENTVPTHHPKIFIATAISWEDAAFRTHWDFLIQALNAQQQTGLLLALKQLVPEYQPQGH